MEQDLERLIDEHLRGGVNEDSHREALEDLRNVIPTASDDKDTLGALTRDLAEARDKCEALKQSSSDAEQLIAASEARASTAEQLVATTSAQLQQAKTIQDSLQSLIVTIEGRAAQTILDATAQAEEDCKLVVYNCRKQLSDSKEQHMAYEAELAKLRTDRDEAKRHSMNVSSQASQEMLAMQAQLAQFQADLAADREANKQARESMISEASAAIQAKETELSLIHI